MLPHRNTIPQTKEDRDMVRHASLFSQLTGLFNRNQFYALVLRHGSEKHAKGFSSWDHFVAMLFCQIAQAKSLREICSGMACCLGKLRHLGVKGAPKRSTLSYANQKRTWKLFQDVFYDTLHLCRQAPSPGKTKFRFRNKLMSLDSSTISLCLSLFPWAEYRQTKGAVKLHLLLDHDGYLPVFACITDGKTHDVTMARQLALSKGSIVVMDRGYNDYKLYAEWVEDEVYFVTRLKDNAAFMVLADFPVPKNRNILVDQTILFTGAVAAKNCPYALRRVVVWDKDQERKIELLTNHLDFGATTIAAIYKDRWEIELFFKALKQNLKVKTFVGTSENALQIQIWTALIAMLLIKFLQFRSRFGWSLSNLVALLRWNLFTYRDLWEWIDHPLETPPPEPAPIQYGLPFKGLGQHY